MLRSLEICAGTGGQALGLEQAGFSHLAAVEMDSDACRTLRHNRPGWNVVEADLHDWDPSGFRGQVDLFAGGVPCPPFSVAGRGLGADDERDLFPRALEIAKIVNPRAIMIENVRGLLSEKFTPYRTQILKQLKKLGYLGQWKLLHASDYGVPQLRPRSVLVALREEDYRYFNWPEPSLEDAPTVGQCLFDLMAAGGWEGAKTWAQGASHIAPTLVGGSKKHGGPDLGPTRAKRAWEALGVNGKSIADAPPSPEFDGLPRLTVEMAARIQGFPDSWKITGKKTAAYRQVGNAFPPPVAKAVAMQIARALERNSTEDSVRLQQGQQELSLA